MVKIQVVTQESDLYEFLITSDEREFRINCFLTKMDDILLLNSVDVEGPGQNTQGKELFNLIQDVCNELCNMFDTKRVIILGAKRTVGRTKGTFFKPIYRKKDDL